MKEILCDVCATFELAGNTRRQFEVDEDSWLKLVVKIKGGDCCEACLSKALHAAALLVRPWLDGQEETEFSEQWEARERAEAAERAAGKAVRAAKMAEEQRRALLAVSGGEPGAGN